MMIIASEMKSQVDAGREEVQLLREENGELRRVAHFSTDFLTHSFG